MPAMMTITIIYMMPLKRKPVAVPYLKHNIREFIKLIDSLMQNSIKVQRHTDISQLH
jgi:hypothetical protein